MVKKKRANSILITALLIAHMLSWVLYMPVSQFQMMLFGEKVLSFMHYAIIEIFIFMLLMVLNKGKLKKLKSNLAPLIVSFMLLLSCIYNLLFNSNVDSFNIIFYLMSWVFPYLVVFLVMQFDYDSMTCDRFFKFLLVICIIHALLILLQHFTNDLIWPYSNYDDGTRIFYTGDNYYQSGSYMARCPGITISGLDAGILLLFGIIISNTMNLERNTRFIINCLFLVSIYFTGTRNIYVVSAYIVGIVLIIKFVKNIKYRRFMMIATTIVACILYLYLVTGMTVFTSTNNILSDNMSIMYRLQLWEKANILITDLPLGSKLFGVLLWQQASGPTIDNFYLETIYCAGIISLIFIIWFIIKLSSRCLRLDSLMSIASSAFILSFFVYGMLNSASNFYLTLIILIFIYCMNLSKRQSGI